MAISIKNFQPKGTLPLWAILRLPSLHSALKGDTGSLDARRTVRDYLPRIPAELLKTMREGVEVDPIHISLGKNMGEIYSVRIPDQLLNTPIVGNGHHRIACAKRLKLEYLDYTNSIFESGADWRSNFPDGKIGRYS